MTDDAIANVEKEIGYKLPSEYLDFLKKQNGGYIRFSLPELVHDSIAGIGPHFPFLTVIDWEECQAYVSFPLQGLVPFDGDGHWHLCLDYRQNSGAPAVTYVDLERDRESRISDSFADYLTMLQVRVADEYVLEDVGNVEDVKTKLCASLAITFYPLDSEAHGYPTHRARINTEKNPEWIWISPNLAPRGFVRADNRRYAELKDLLPGYALRFPEAPASCLLLSATKGVQAKVIEACVQAEMIARPLREYVKRSQSVAEASLTPRNWSAQKP